MLGELTDKEVADRIGVSSTSVHKRRNRLGILSIKKIRWSEEDDAVLGTDTDRNVAKRLGVSLTSVFERRSQLGIPSYADSANTTERDREIIELYNECKTFQKMADALSISKQRAHFLYQRAKSNLCPEEKKQDDTVNG